MNCPVCNVPLQMTERQGVEIDYCSQCRGVWLDRGELDKIIDRSSEAGPSDYGDRRERGGREGYPQQGYPQQGRRHYKKKSMWRELFDFD